MILDEVKMMKRVQQQSIEYSDCGVACAAMLAGCSYLRVFQAFVFADNQREFYTGHHHLISALEKLGCAGQEKTILFVARNT